MDIILNLPFGMDIYKYKRKLIDDYSFNVIYRKSNSNIKRISMTGDYALVTHFSLMDFKEIIKINFKRKLYIIKTDTSKSTIRKLIDEGIFIILESRFNYKILEEYLLKDFSREKMYKKYQLNLSKLKKVKEDFIEILRKKKPNYYEKLKKKFKEKSKNLNVSDKKEVISFKKRLLAIWDNPEFASELAYILAKKSKLNVLLIDGDRLNPSLDYFFNVDKFENKLYNHLGKIRDSGFNIVLNSIKKEIINEEIFSKATIEYMDNLNLLMGNYDLNNYEYYDKENLISLIDYANSYYDVILINVNKHIYDIFTCISFIKSDTILVPIRPSLNKIREFKNYIKYLMNKQNIPKNKYKFIAYEYDHVIDLDLEVIKEVCNNNLIGKIKFNDERRYYRNLKDIYLNRIKRNNKKQYLNIIEELKIW